MDILTRTEIVALARYYLPALKWGMAKEKAAYPAAYIQAGAANLKSLAGYNNAALSEYLSDFEWRAEKVDHITAPEIVVQRKWDDCDGSAWLLNALRPVGKIYLILNITQGKPQKVCDWHYIYIENGNVWSNFRLDKTGLADQQDLFIWIKKTYKFANLFIEIKADLSGIGAINEL